MANKKEKIPIEFVRKFLRAKGRYWLHNVWCDCKLDLIETDHPIKWLWNHVQQGHEPSFDCCFCWNRQIGRDTGEFEEWYKWRTFSWNSQCQNFEMTDCYQGVEGFEEICPTDIRQNQRDLGILSPERRR